MNQSNISEQAEKYAEVIVGQIAGNFRELHKALKDCTELKELKISYDNLSPNDTTLMDIDKTRDRLKIIENSIGDLICDKYNTVEPLAVGLFGEWGSGKTHQLKLIQQRIKYMQSEKHKKDKNEKNKICLPKTTIPVFFNAWRFEKEEHIIIPLFQTLLDAVEHHERSLGEKVGRSLKSTVYHLKNVLFALHHGISWSSAYKTARGIVTNNIEDMGEVSNVLNMKKPNEKAKEKTNKEQVGKQTLSELITPDRMESIYLNIPQWIEKITLFENVNFVFLIDDLDRCLPENTLKMLESIKLFLDVPSCAFVLAVDDDVVERGVVHHYRDYLSIYHGKDTEGVKGAMQHELPITGHEYLEKMIQLPIIRLPVIDTVNVRVFLEEHSSGWIELIDRKGNPKGLRTTTTPIDITESLDMNEEFYISPVEKLLDFFSEVIPPKPRKIKRTAKLFETKLMLLDSAGLLDKIDYMFVAKITLLELFAPKLLRFIQNNGYDSMYNRLVEFKKKKESLTEFEDIKTYIERKVTTKDLSKEPNKSKKQKIQDDGDYYAQKEQQLYTRMMHIVKEHYTSRIQFDLDTVFTRDEDKKDLQKIIEMREKVKVTTKVTHELQGNEFSEKLFKADDVQSWRDAFKVDKLFEEGKATLTDNQLKSIMRQAKEKKLHLNYEWRNAIIPYITGEQLKKDLYFEMCSTTVTKGEFETFVEAASYETEAETNGGIYVYNGKEWEKKKDASWKNSYIKDETDKHPVVGVSWNDAKAYVEWKNKTDEKYEYVLPTEHEWYLACNNGKDTKWHFGDDESQLKEYAWYSENSGMKTHEVETRKSNDLGLYDMHGNVWEWCEDWYDEDKNSKVLRGGSWVNVASSTESAFRGRGYPANSVYIVGFRLQRTLRS